MLQRGAARSSTSEPMHAACMNAPSVHRDTMRTVRPERPVPPSIDPFPTGTSLVSLLLGRALCQPAAEVAASECVRDLITLSISRRHQRSADQDSELGTSGAPDPPRAPATGIAQGSGHGRKSTRGTWCAELIRHSSSCHSLRPATSTAEQRGAQQRGDRRAACYPLLLQAGCTAHATSPHLSTRRGLHGLASVMTAAESARDLLSAIAQPASYAALAEQLALQQPHSAELFEALGGLVHSRVEELSGEPAPAACVWGARHAWACRITRSGTSRFPAQPPHNRRHTPSACGRHTIRMRTRTLCLDDRAPHAAVDVATCLPHAQLAQHGRSAC